MSNTYTKPSDLVSGTTARASDINDRASATETGFDNVQVITHRAIKLPVGTSGDQFISESSANRANKEVGFNASGVLTLISSAFQWKGNWATSTAYIKNDTVRDNSTKNIYAVLVDHTSGTLSSDVSASKLALAINVADVETAKSAAQTAQAAAETAETNAETAESNAETAESNAASSATASANSATAGANSATAAANSATAGANSATAGANSATAGANSATASSNSASTASTQATNSSNSATAGANSATAAASSASTATTKANQASASASTASTQATNASNSATASANSATASANSATASANSASGASTSANNAAASYDSFDDRFLGSKSSNPSVDNDGGSLLTGAMYWSTSSNFMKVYNGSAWVGIAPSAADQALINIVGGELTATEDLGSIATSNTTSVGNKISVVGNAIANVNTVGGAIANVNTVGAGIANVNAVGSGIANVNIVAGSIANVNRYANEYKISSSAPAGPSSGDLWYDSTANILKYYTGSAFSGIVSGITSVAGDSSPQLAAALDGQNNNMTNIGTIAGSNLQMDFGGLS